MFIIKTILKLEDMSQGFVHNVHCCSWWYWSCDGVSIIYLTEAWMIFVPVYVLKYAL